jgi:hypothetical protein
MPDGGLLFANDHQSGRTVVIDLKDPLHPRIHAAFGDLAGFSHPHSFLRLPNGHVLASFQFDGHMEHGGSVDGGAPVQAAWLDRFCNRAWRGVLQINSLDRIGRDFSREVMNAVQCAQSVFQSSQDRP